MNGFLFYQRNYDSKQLPNNLGELCMVMSNFHVTSSSQNNVGHLQVELRSAR